MSISDLVALEPGAGEKVPGLIAEGLIQGEQAIKGQLVLTVKGRLLADAVVRILTD
jgi:oxygen-independent coproporphyrinogen-3 oxidase